jgi:hypothetical protein
MPEAAVTRVARPAAPDAACAPCPATTPTPGQASKGSEVRVARCAAHGVAYDTEREVCPECAKGTPLGVAPSLG